jgi:hypothetical protein
MIRELARLKSVPAKIASALLSAEQAMKHEIIPACRRWHLPHSRLSRRRGRDRRRERLRSGGEGRRGEEEASSELQD